LIDFFRRQQNDRLCLYGAAGVDRQRRSGNSRVIRRVGNHEGIAIAEREIERLQFATGAFDRLLRRLTPLRPAIL
jgi:hypothetical protein